MNITQTAGLPLSATLMVLVAAVAHASWNAIAHGMNDKLAAITLLSIGGAAFAVPLLFLTPAPHADAWPWLIASVVVHIAYNLLLMTAYRLGDFSQMYPLARGSAPMVVTLLAAVFVHELPPPLELAGVFVVSAGLASLVFVGGRVRRHEWPAISAALATGITIATYTVIDGTGVRASGSPGAYVAWLMLIDGAVMVGYAVVRRGPALFGQLRTSAVPGLLGGALSLTAYGLVLWAQTRGPLAPISALRETSIVVGAVIGAVIFKEGFGPRRIAATAIVFAGVLLINFS